VSELAPALEALAERPPRRHGVVEHDGASIAGDDAEREALPDAPSIAVRPHLSPAARQVDPLPAVAGPLRGDGLDVASAGDVEDEHGDPPPVALHLEPDAAALVGARHAAVLHGDDPDVEVGDEAQEHGLGQVEVPQRRVAPVLVRLRVVRRAQVRRRHRHRRAAAGAERAPLAPYLVAAAAGPALVEERHAQRRRLQPVPLLQQVAVATRTLCMHGRTVTDWGKKKVRTCVTTNSRACKRLTHGVGAAFVAVERGVRRLPLLPVVVAGRRQRRQKQQQCCRHHRGRRRKARRRRTRVHVSH